MTEIKIDADKALEEMKDLLENGAFLTVEAIFAINRCRTIVYQARQAEKARMVLMNDPPWKPIIDLNL